jgi:hypothetical protein
MSRLESQVLSSWFDEKYLYRIEEGDPKYSPTKIEAVRRDGGDFDDFQIENLKRKLISTSFPMTQFAISLETDEFRRFVRIYVESLVPARRNTAFQSISIVPKDEIRSRLSK